MYLWIKVGCPISPLLFLLIIKGIRRLIEVAKKKKKIKGINIPHSLHISHLLFVNVLIFGRGFVPELECYISIINTFCEASGMPISA